jgi:hypothetical protein
VTGKGHLTRIWAAEPLIEMFMDAALGYFDIGYPENKATAILRAMFRTPPAHLQLIPITCQQTIPVSPVCRYPPYPGWP